jgi:intein/homing endonuclease
MITNETISKFYKDVEALGLKFPVAAISKATGYSKGNVSQYLQKKDEPSENFISKFYEKFAGSIKKVPRATSIEAKAEGKSDSDIMRILTNLSESHRNLTAAHKEISESNNKLADNEQMILLKMSTSGVHPGMPSDALATLLAVRAQVIELVADAKKTTLEEAEAVLGRKAVVEKKKLDKKGSDVGAGRKHTA